MKILLLSILLLSSVVGFVVFSSFPLGEDEVFILTDQYKGPVFVLLNQPNGNSVIIRENTRAFEIPQGGVLKVNSDLASGWHSLWKFYYRRGNELIELPYTMDANQRSEDRVQVCCFSTGKSYSNDTGKAVEFASFVVGTKSDIENSLDKMEKIHVADFAEN